MERRYLDGQWSGGDIAVAKLTTCTGQLELQSRPPAGEAANISQKIASHLKFYRM